MDKTKEMHDKGFPMEVLTVDKHCDGFYVYFRLLEEDPERAAEVHELFMINQGNSTGIGIGCVSWDGSVHADQFWRHYSFGNVKDRHFSEIWIDTSDELMAGLKERKALIKVNADRCVRCKWLEICNANFRVRVEAIYDNVWADDPACCLTKEESGTMRLNKLD